MAGWWWLRWVPRSGLHPVPPVRSSSYFCVRVPDPGRARARAPPPLPGRGAPHSAWPCVTAGPPLVELVPNLGDQRGRFSWSPGTVLLVTRDGSSGHQGRFLWTPGTVPLVTGAEGLRTASWVEPVETLGRSRVVRRGRFFRPGRWSRRGPVSPAWFRQVGSSDSDRFRARPPLMGETPPNRSLADGLISVPASTRDRVRPNRPGGRRAGRPRRPGRPGRTGCRSRLHGVPTAGRR